MLRENKACDWDYIKNLYPMASSTPKHIGYREITRSNPLNSHLVLYKGKPKGRHRLNRAGERTYCKHSEVHSEREKEPWLLATSLSVSSTLAKRVVKLYSARMQIEEAFRDIKSYRYGTGLELNLTRVQQRLQILMLIGMLATLVLWLLGTVVIMSGEARHYQANTEKKRRVLSTLFLGLRVSSDNRVTVSDSQLAIAYDRLVTKMREHTNLPPFPMLTHGLIHQYDNRFELTKVKFKPSICGYSQSKVNGREHLAVFDGVRLILQVLLAISRRHAQ